MLQLQWRSLQEMLAEVSAVYAESSCFGNQAGHSELPCIAVADPGKCSFAMGWLAAQASLPGISST